MATDALDVLMEVDELLHHPAPEKSVQMALALLKKHAKQKLLLCYFAKALVLVGEHDKALKKADAALDADSSASWPHFWRAAALVGLGAPPKAWAPALRLAYKGDRAAAKEAMAQPVFAPVRNSSEFLGALGRKPNAPVASPQVKKLISLAAADEPYRLLKSASALGAHADQASVVDAMLHALEVICEDLDEHGEANLADYGGLKPAYFRKSLKECRAARKRLSRGRSAFAAGLELQ